MRGACRCRTRGQRVSERAELHELKIPRASLRGVPHSHAKGLGRMGQPALDRRDADPGNDLHLEPNRRSCPDEAQRS